MRDDAAVCPQGPTLRLVAPNVVGDLQGNRTLTTDGGGAEPDPLEAPSTVPALLVSFVYLQSFMRNRSRYRMRDWALDSGAFSAYNSGKEIVLEEYIKTAKGLWDSDPQLTDVFALDVIYHPEASLKNAIEIERQGLPCIPCFHVGEPEEFLVEMAARWPKIALGGMGEKKVPRKDRLKFLEQSFARIWPKKVHGFAIASEDVLMRFPFHSVDASSWELGPCRFGNWKSFGQISIRGSKQDLRAEVEHYLKLEWKVRCRWRKEMELLERLFPTPARRKVQ